MSEHTPTLLPCPNPWCEQSTPVIDHLYEGDGGTDWVVRCKTCDLFAPICDTETEAIAAWNQRTACNHHDELVAALREARDAVSELTERFGVSSGGLIVKIDTLLAKIGGGA